MTADPTIRALALLETWAAIGKVEIARSLLGTGYEVGHLASGRVGVGRTLVAAIEEAAK